MSEVSNNGVPGYTTSTAGDYTILTPEDKKASVFQKVTPREQYLVAREVANRAIDEINAIRANRASSFTDGINAANIAARRQAAETYGATLPGGSSYDGAREAAYATADAYKSVLDDAAARGRLTSTAPQIARITGDWGYGPSIPYPKEPFSDWTTDEAPIDDESSASGNYDEWINQQYRELLGRDAGTEGLNYWTGDLERGQTKDQVRANIMLSDEFKNRSQLVDDYRDDHGSNPDEDWLDARVGPGGEWLMEGYGSKKKTSVGETDTVEPFETTWEPTANYDGGGYTPGDFGRGPQYAEYEDMYRNSINEGFTLEEAMRNSRTSTPQDFLNAFGSRDEWKKWGGGRGPGHIGGKSSSSSSGNSVASGKTTFRAPSFSSFGSSLMGGN